MKKKGIDIPVEFMALVDAQLRLFDRDYTFTELMSMDIPFKKSLVLGRLANLERSRKRLEETKEVDQFSKHDLSLGNMLGNL